MFDGASGLLRQLFRFVIAALAVTSSIMLVVWNLNMNAPTDQRSATERTRDEVKQLRISEGLGANGVPSFGGGIMDQLSRVAEAFANALEKMRSRDKGALESRERDLKGLFAIQLQQRELPQQQTGEQRVQTAPSARRGLSAKDAAAVQEYRNASVQESAVTSKIIGAGAAAGSGIRAPAQPSAQPQPAQPSLLALAKAPPAPPAPPPAATSGFTSLSPMNSTNIANMPPPAHLAAPEIPVAKGVAPALRPAIQPPEKPSALAMLQKEANDVLAVLNTATEDFRIFPHAMASYNSFAERYPNSTQRRTMQPKFETLLRTYEQATEERKGLNREAKLTSVSLPDAEFDLVFDCLAVIPKLKTAALARKVVTAQPNVPAYFVLTDVEQPAPASKAEAAERQIKDADERAEISEKVGACFSNQRANGTVTVLFWTDAESRAAGLLFAKLPDALIFSRD